MTNKSVRAAFLASGVLLAAVTAGCEPDRIQILQQQLDASQERTRQLEEANKELVGIVATQDKQIETLLALGEKRLENVVHVRSVTLGKWSGGYDSDGVDGDEGVKVYLLPRDGDNTAVKAAGALTVQVFDLASDPTENLVGEYTWTVEELAKTWSSGLMSYHYSLECPWQSGPPAHQELTIRATFIDYLTGKTFTTQKVGKVKLAGHGKPVE
jgi:hypothetical protein